MRVLYLMAVSLLTLAAQQLPDAGALLKQSGDALKTYATYQYSESSSAGPGGMEMVYQGASSGKMRVTQKIGDMDGILIVADGQNMWMYMAMMKRYMKLPMDSSVMDDLTGAIDRGSPGEAGKSAKVVRPETIEVDGEPHDCWVVENRIGELSSPAAPGANVKSGTATHWIDKISGIEYKTVIASPVQVPGQEDAVEMTTTMSRHGYKFNLPLDDSLFVFTPPAGSTETDELFPGMKATFSKPEEKPAAAPVKSAAAQVPLAGEPQAFVPNRVPIEKADPVRPTGVAVDGRGEVALIVIIDPVGNVVSAEALTGAEPLRKAAIDAVEQWKFHPVIRNGVPVAAYTQAMVDFTDYSKPVQPARPDMQDEMAAAQRALSLEEKFPRTAQQAFADLEQDRGESTGVDRSWALPDLAKAAFKANALDKAAAYAGELVSEPSTDSNYGQAVHDGNMVLGLIAIQQGDVARAKHHLAESAKTTGSPVLDSFGPNMLLAKALLEKGERDAVVEYFESCKSFWKMGAKQLDAWIAAVREGGMPSLGANLVY